jgi:hypothetical protein
MKKLLTRLFAALSVFSLTVLSAAAEDGVAGIDYPAGFLGNIKYMGLGMFGIFLVIGVVIVITNILNSVTGKKK